MQSMQSPHACMHAHLHAITPPSKPPLSLPASAWADAQLLTACWLSTPVHMQAGTLSGNPLAMTAGIKTLQILERQGTYEYLDKITGRLINGILDAARDAGHAVCGGHISGTLYMPCHQNAWGFPFCHASCAVAYDYSAI